MNYPIGKKVIVCAKEAGIFYAILSDYDPQTQTAELKNCRRIRYWDGACSISQLAVEGTTKPDDCEFSLYVPVMQVMGVVEITPCLEEGIKSIESVKIWKIS